MVRIFSPCQLQVYVSIGTLESDLLSQSTPCGTKWTLVYLFRLYSTSAAGFKLHQLSSYICDILHAKMV